MYKKSTIFVFVVTVFIAAALQIILPYSGVGKGIQNLLFVGPFLGLVWINILLFALPVCIGLVRMIKDGLKENTQKQDEKELKELLQGNRIGKSEMPAWARIGVVICIGLIAGSILGYTLENIIM